MSPASWPTWVWVGLTLTASTLRLDYTVGDYTAATAVAIGAGALLGPRRGATIQALALLALVPLAPLGWLGQTVDLGYAVGRIGAAALAGRWAAAGRPPVVNWPIRVVLLALFGAAAWSTNAWSEPTLGLHLKSYYAGVIGLGVVIGFWYALRLVARPARIFGFVGSLTPYYGAGLVGVVIVSWLSAAGLEPTIAELVFQGLAVHLPGDVLSAVVVAFLLDPRTRHRRIGSR